MRISPLNFTSTIYFSIDGGTTYSVLNSVTNDWQGLTAPFKIGFVLVCLVLFLS